MNKLCFLLFLLLFSTLPSCKPGQQPNDIAVMSFNIRYNNPADSLNSWPLRAESVAEAMLFHNADIIGTQEVLHDQLIKLKSHLSDEYNAIGVGRDDGLTQGEYAALWYKKSRFELADSGNFWLSETPDIAGSRGWDAACVRIATWAILRDKDSGRELFALNTHFDHVGQTARAESVELILNRSDSLSAGRPIIITGDFNSTPQSNVVISLTDTSNPKHLCDTRTSAQISHGPNWSYHEFFNMPIEKRSLIDFIFYRGPLSVNRYAVLAEVNNSGRPLSDHCPVIATFSWTDKN